ncbi:hypothetical protein KFK09_026995 [Dendrobium nobile]|uniref:GAG-pre-integrase domain-containing protein n=1 Tax=Dendrobium nobile TaxID=94219 RepID=A0A8T3A9C5_DENNO|nr:hypothetical protein KFK09_026995 [Dendrobium nobile]
MGYINSRLLSNVTQALHTARSISTPWHARLGHPNARKLQHLANTVPDITLSSLNVCVSCNMSKSHKQPFVTSTSVCHKPFELVHSDVWGPAPTPSTQGYRYYVVFIDEFTRFTWLYLL